MTEILAIFRSRSQAIDCAARLRCAGVPSALINTPKEAGTGCGLSVRFPERAAKKVRAIVASARYSAFYGYMKASNIR